MDPDQNSHGSSMASTFVKYDFLNHKKDGEHAVEIVKILKEKGLTIDGCVTFWEDCGPLAATICDLLHLNGPGQHAAEIAKKKFGPMRYCGPRQAISPIFQGRTCMQQSVTI